MYLKKSFAKCTSKVKLGFTRSLMHCQKLVLELKKNRMGKRGGLHKYLDQIDFKGPSIKDVRRISPIFDPLPPLSYIT